MKTPVLAHSLPQGPAWRALAVLAAVALTLSAALAAVTPQERGVHAASTPESKGMVKRSKDRAPTANQRRKSPDAVPAGLKAADWASLVQPVNAIAQQGFLKASNAGMADEFGYSVAISGDTVVIGAISEASNATGVNGNQTNNSAFGAGAAYVYVRIGTNWTQQAYLKASNTEGFDEFGGSVAISGDTVAIGAWGESSSATGVNGDQNNDNAEGAGAAYVYMDNGTNWSQRAYLKGSNTRSQDEFGIAVAVAGDTLVVGAFGEDSIAGSSGAVYVFNDVGLGSRITLVRDGSGGYFIRFTGAPEITYHLESDISLTGSWPTIDTQTAPASGLVELHDRNAPPGQAFYRVASP